ncbi:MAG: DNA polymerase I [Blastopirellula sp.]|nr:MAG: DNA polymerase I [Blastopirellula sp.]
MSPDKRQQSLGFSENPPEKSTKSDSTPELPTAAAPVNPASTVVSSPETQKLGAAGLKGAEVWILDSFSLIFQVFHALPPMTGASGQPVSAIYGFCRDVVNLIREKKPDYFLCAYDLPGPTFRHDLYGDYKVNRSEMPEDLVPQIPAIEEMLGALNIPVISHENHEADDVLATLAKMVDEQGGKCVVVTSDKDCRQFITENVQLYNIRKHLIYDAESLKQDWGIRPDQVVDFQSLVGDSVDNVPGVPLFGPKLAKELLLKFDTLDQVLENADSISGKKRKENLINGKEDALMSRTLVKLVDDLPLEIDWDACRISPVNQEAVEGLCRDYAFRSLSQQLLAIGSSGAGDKVAPETEWESDYTTIETEEQLDELVALLSEQTQIAVDTETTSTNPRWADIVGYSFSWAPTKACYIPVRAPEGDVCLDPVKTLETLRPILENPNIEKIGQNLKYDMVVLRSAGCEMQGVTFDTMVAHYLLEAGARSHGLDELSRRYLGHETLKISDLIGKGKNQITMDQVPVELVSPYAAEDADVPIRLLPILGEKLQSEALDDLFTNVEIPLIDTLVEMEFNGISIDTERLAQLSKDFTARMDQLESEIYMLAGHEFNIASPKQLGKILFEELELPVIKKTKTGASTDAEVLDQLAHLHDLPAKIIEYRQYAKLRNTYVDALPLLICEKTGRIHTSFNQVVAATGRLSSNEPNLQNIPVRTQEGRDIRSAFLAGHEGWHLLAADYSQIELRVLAHFSKDETMMASYMNNEDIHASVAAEVYNVSLDEVTTDQRRSAKAINFGVIYGQSPFGLAKSLNIDKDEAYGFIDSYFKRYPGVDEFMEHVLVECQKDGFVRTALGRRRQVDGVRSPHKRDRTKRQLTMPERTAINTVIQGSAADIIKLAMLKVHARLQKENSPAKMLLQIHDELLFESPQEYLPELASLVREEMSAAYELIVPLVVDVKSGINWADCEPM